MKKTLQLLFALFLTIGLLMSIISGGICTAALTSLQQEEQTEGVIIALHENPDTAVVHYTVQGKDYTAPLSYYTSSMRVGDPITVYFKPGTPEKIHCRESTVLTGWIVGGIGILFALIGGIGLLAVTAPDRRKKQLLRCGDLFCAEITEITQNLAVTVNGRSPYFVQCVYHDCDRQEMRSCKSEALWEDPSSYLHPGMKVMVLVDRNHPNRTYVDLSRLSDRS